jgi:hypothetical protein
MKFFTLLVGEKTNPIQSQFGCFTAENAECAEVFDV